MFSALMIIRNITLAVWYCPQQKLWLCFLPEFTYSQNTWYSGTRKPHFSNINLTLLRMCVIGSDGFSKNKKKTKNISIFHAHINCIASEDISSSIGAVWLNVIWHYIWLHCLSLAVRYMWALYYCNTSEMNVIYSGRVAPCALTFT